MLAVKGVVADFCGATVHKGHSGMSEACVYSRGTFHELRPTSSRCSLEPSGDQEAISAKAEPVIPQHPIQSKPR
jgi:hypothetical protein